MRVPIGIRSKDKQRRFLDYLNANLRQHISSSSGQAGFKRDGTFESVITGAFSLDNTEVVLTWKFFKSKEGILEYIEVICEEDNIENSEWTDKAHKLIYSSLASALEKKQKSFFVRRKFFYVGPQLDGEYWIRGFRFAPAFPEDPKPYLLNAERPIVIETKLKAIDSRHLVGIANEFANRQSARLSLLLNVGIYKSEQVFRWVLEKNDKGKQISQRHQLGFSTTNSLPNKMPMKEELCPLGKYQSELRAKYRYAGELLSLPAETRKVYRAIEESNKNIEDAFDHCARLYQTGRVIGLHYPSAGLAYQVAAVESITQAIPEFDGFSDFVRRFVEPKPELDTALDFLYASVRSAHFHGGKFPFGEFSNHTLSGPLMDSDQIEKSSLRTLGFQITREAIVNWLLSEVDGEVKNK